ncbi:MAG: sigma-54-dependent Fis family transcriptional regulator, partial [Alistipes sp.]|nr:sigma-54-dependent Fis family transcriptional regulator [Alistipes sp.]
KRDIPLLFRKFASDVAVQYRMPAIVLDDSARELLMNYYWRGNIRQLKNVAEQISAVENVRTISAEVLATYLPDVGRSHPATTRPMGQSSSDFTNERELLYKLLFDMRAEIGDLKRMVAELMQRTGGQPMETPRDVKALLPSVMPRYEEPVEVGYAETEEVEEEPRERTKADVQREQILRALRRNNGRRKEAAAELFMSERTLYRKIKELGIEE